MGLQDIIYRSANGGDLVKGCGVDAKFDIYFLIFGERNNHQW